jgi:hypothetical protein
MNRDPFNGPVEKVCAKDSKYPARGERSGTFLLWPDAGMDFVCITVICRELIFKEIGLKYFSRSSPCRI